MSDRNLRKLALEASPIPPRGPAQRGSTGISMFIDIHLASFYNYCGSTVSRLDSD